MTRDTSSMAQCACAIPPDVQFVRVEHQEYLQTQTCNKLVMLVTKGKTLLTVLALAGRNTQRKKHCTHDFPALE